MSFLVLTDDDIALLRFTCDLFFVEESPLFHLESEQREPKDFSSAYHALVERGVIDPRRFRITDAQLNRIAPVTECDARITHVVRGSRATPRQTEYWLLEGIAVAYQLAESRHVFGADLDQDELVEVFARHLVPRRAGGDRIDLTLNAVELVALSVLLDNMRQRRTRAVEVSELSELFRKPPPESMRAPALYVHGRRGGRSRADSIVDEPGWDDALRSLIEKGAARIQDTTLWLHSGLMDLATGEVGEKHTIVRTDFGEDDWLVRETTFIPVEGSLFVVGPRRGGMGVEELDGDRLRRALIDAVAAPGRDRPASPSQRLSELMVRGDPVKA